jgi:hypothetical protein
MFSKTFPLIVLLGGLTIAATLPRAEAQAPLFSAEARQKPEALLKQMTLDEKIGQLSGNDIER